MRHLHTKSLAAAAMFLTTAHGAAQHLWWDTP